MQSGNRNKPLALIEAGSALFRAALTAMPIGALTGMCAGLFFYGIGSVFGAVIGLPVGFVAALFGGAVGRRHGWVISGAVCGFLGGCAIYESGERLIFRFATGLVLFLIVLPTVCGTAAGWFVGDHLDNIHVKPKGLLASIERQLYYSPLYGQSLTTRLALAAAEAAPLLATIAFLWRLHLNG